MSNSANMGPSNERPRSPLSTVNEEDESRFRENTRDSIDSLDRQFDEQERTDKELRNVLVNRKFRSKSRLRFDKVNDSNKRTTYMELEDNAQGSSINPEASLDNVTIIWQPHGFDDPPDNTKHYIANVEELKQAMVYRSGIVLRELKWHVNEVKDLKLHLAVVRPNPQFSAEFKRIEKHVNDLKDQNDRLETRHESDKTRHQSDKSRFAKLHEAYEKTCEKIKELEITVESQQKEIEGFVAKKDKQKQPVPRAFVSSEEEDIDDIINNSSGRRRQPIEIDPNNFTRSPILHIRRNLFDASISLRGSTTLADDKDELPQERGRSRRMELDDHDREYMGNRGNARWPDIKDFDGSCTYEAFLDWMQFAEIKLEADARMFSTVRLQINYVALHCTGTAKKLIRKRTQRDSFNPFKSVDDLFHVLRTNFGRTNEEKSAVLELKDPSTRQRADEPFSTFAARLSAIMNTTTFSDIVKISELRERMNYRLKQLIINIQEPDDYLEYINRIISIDNNNTEFQHSMKRNYGDKEFKTKQKDTRFKFNSRQRGFFFNKVVKSSRKASTVEGGMARLDAATKKKVLEKELCARCFLSGHRANDKNAPCKDKPPVSVEEAGIRLAAVGIKYVPDQGNDSSEEAPERYPDTSSSSDSEN